LCEAILRFVYSPAFRLFSYIVYIGQTLRICVNPNVACTKRVKAGGGKAKARTTYGSYASNELSLSKSL
jgi:hypothetical protein